MTEEIIDGIDVSECSFLLERDNKQKCECCHATGFGVICDCDKWHNCYYKQLQRAKAELQELNKKYSEVLSLSKQNADSNEYCIQELEAENEKLKAEIKQMVDENYASTDWREMEDLRAENERLREEIRQHKKDYSHTNAEYRQERESVIQLSYWKNKYHRTLQEIKEMLQNEHPFKDCSCGQDILDIISEVENAEK